MPPAESLLILSATTLIGLALLGTFAAWGWSGWLRLKTRELERHGSTPGSAGDELPAVGQRIDLADLKERIRKLEAIAAGVDL